MFPNYRLKSLIEIHNYKCYICNYCVALLMPAIVIKCVMLVIRSSKTEFNVNCKKKSAYLWSVTQQLNNMTIITLKFYKIGKEE